MRRLIAPLLLVLALPACGADHSARVVGISDGDTITVLTPAKQQVKIRPPPPIITQAPAPC